ncbi:serpin family protein [Leptolyngbya sp. FACHB-541]|uniref:serpin family protein n=1 Tax=Leptolyngbya sp. FACHB-541 TaxID=2692810 RepID=UPI001688FE51|nr:serpin family protein [Leptolyngbya sp. FACHB-541]MBD1998640.1 serpin family protein [Leptolyngbya sp. FACHB-541]
MSQQWFGRPLIALAGGMILLGLTLGTAVKFGRQAIAQSPPSSPPTMNQIEDSDEDLDMNARLVAANTRFGFKLFSQILEQNGQPTNLMVSPTSVAIALTMTYNGASGTTQQAMAEALELEGMSLEEINQANAALELALENADPEVQLAIANSLWSREDTSFNPDFLQRNRDFYSAEVASLDFTNPSAIATINNWVSRNTQEKISEIIQDIRPNAVLFLINATYFKGNWTTPFNAERTSDRPFTLLDSSQKQHPTMTQSGRYAYLENDQFQAVSLPYGESKRLSMYVFLPRENSSLSAFQQSLTAENWETWMSQFGRQEGAISLPRFKLEYTTQLNDVLEALGMGVAFTDQADFSGMSDEPLSISQVQHKTFIEVNEEGTEAAAVTSVEIQTLSAPTAPFQMTADRPFFYAIRDNQTETVLFMGTVVEPE